jgi:hypothetical protein
MQGNVSDPYFVVRTINDGTMTMVCESIGSPSLLTYTQVSSSIKSVWNIVS